ncbi:uncharacterized protein FRV6_16946 [Fusarium oxysporum]|uniref:Uncharacterized protein n=1 Tax=Fusarium oxysporum TaxID=5507 RepID=A0A2H3TW34_FUSOX|nr:uncharacterized protein FRV6_16946 [Fusarium oxysporum]
MALTVLLLLGSGNFVLHLKLLHLLTIREEGSQKKGNIIVVVVVVVIVPQGIEIKLFDSFLRRLAYTGSLLAKDIVRIFDTLKMRIPIGDGFA